MLIDSGTPTSYFKDVVESSADLVDFVKFGWGTSLVTRDIHLKIDVLQHHGVEYFFGGTLFEKFHLQGKTEEYAAYCRDFGCRHVEISNGTILLPDDEKSRLIGRFAGEFRVFSETGYKDPERSINLRPAKWIEYLKRDLAAGASYVVTEARESGTSGIVRMDGEVRYGLMEEIFDAVDVDRIVFEAPTRPLQTYFIRRLGPSVNLANIPFGEAIGLETLRLGLRSDTLTLFESGQTQEGK